VLKDELEGRRLMSSKAGHPVADGGAQAADTAAAGEATASRR
jgi:hypothetical protein